MDFPTDELLKEVLKYPAVKQIQVTLKSSAKYALIVGGSTLIGGIIAGPLGLAVGGMVSSAISAAVANNEFESVPYIILYETTPEQRTKLAKLIVKFLRLNNIWTFYDFLFNKEQFAFEITSILIKFLIDDMHYTIKH